MDWTQYAVGGAAARPDSFTGLNPQFASGLSQMVQAAHSAGIPLQITSAYRSPEVQARLWEGALQKYGSPEAARKWVAPPGRSQHNFGTAADFAVNGGLLRDANSPAAQWVRENAAKYGLAVPMDWEPWQVELAGARGNNGGATMRNDVNLPEVQAPQPQQEGRGDRRRDFFDTLAIGLQGMTLNPNQALIQAVQSRMQGRAQGRQTAQQRNATADWLASKGAQDLAEGVRTGAIPAAAALQMMQQRAAGPEPVKGTEIEGRLVNPYTGEVMADFSAGQRATAKEQQIDRLVSVGIPRDTAIKIADGVYTVSRDPFTDQVQVIDKATGSVVQSGQDALSPATEAIPEPSAPQLSFPSDQPTAGGREAFGLPGMLAGTANTISDALGAGEVFPEVAEQQRFFRVLEEEILVDLSQAYGRQPAAALMERLRSLAPQVGTMEGANRAQGELEQLRSRFVNDLESAKRSISRSAISPEERAQRLQAISGLESAVRRVDEALTRLGAAPSDETGKTSGKTSSGITWSVD